MTRTPPDLAFEDAARAHGYARIAGVDEVGRGPLAGPVMACAVILDPAAIPPGLADSKTISAMRRDALFTLIPQMALVGYGQASVDEIEALNILAASHLAMQRALADLPVAADFALIDGNRMPPALPCAGRTIVRGDTLSLSIAAASIMAKVWRDNVMVGLAQQHPGYGWDRNAGYPTPEHHAGLKCHGVSPHHRRTFAPIHKMLWQEKT
ncbi:RNase HII [Loktanella fryxellensis]|uniref:Ribonuclease HII n=1 Tax=Loktanella fryxellensis TaxID=245187 RepID=A0A1H8HRS2_9RHOB|nr:ribonuclease HII [Loktanella fryxellensis]SEN59000.1 RNase HII [Loktanella fryxellensis]